LVFLIDDEARAHLTRRQVKLFAARGVVHTLAVIAGFLCDGGAHSHRWVTNDNCCIISLGAALFLGEQFAATQVGGLVIMALVVVR
jgi:hypothetical protein